MRRRLPVLLLLLLPAAPFLPSPWSALALATVGILWLTGVRSRRERLWTGLALAAAALVLAAPGLLGWFQGRATIEDVGVRSTLAERYEGLWEELEREAERSALVFGPPPEPLTLDDYQRDFPLDPDPPADALGSDPSSSPRGTADAFARLDRLVRASTASAEDRPSFFLVDRDGSAFAWAGAGLAAEPLFDAVSRARSYSEPLLADLPREGGVFVPGYRTVTLLAVTPLEAEERPWRLVVGRSLATDRWPFEPPGSLGTGRSDAAEADDGPPVVWSLATPGTPVADGVARIRVRGRPDLVIEAFPGSPPAPWETDAARLAWILIAVLLLGLAVFRGFRADRLDAVVDAGSGGRDPGQSVGLWALVVTVAGAGAVAATLGLGARPAASLVLGAGVLALASRRGLPARWRPGGLRSAARWGAVVVAALTAVSWLLQRLMTPAAVTASGRPEGLLGATDLGSELLGDPSTLAVRAGFGALAGALLVWSRRHPEDDVAEEPSDTLAWGAIALLVLAGTVHDWPWIAWPLAGGGAALAVSWISDRRLSRATTLAVTALLSVLLGAVTWETVDRLSLRRSLEDWAAPRMAPPTVVEERRLSSQLAAYLGAFDLATIVPRSPEGLDREDLAYAVWEDSPLSHANAFSTLVVEPFGVAGSSFSFGPPLDDPGADWYQTVLDLPVWNALVLSGTAEIRWNGEPWGRARYWLAPRPGFALQSDPSSETVRRGLLRERILDESSPRGLPRPAIYGLYERSQGISIISPWGDMSSLDPEVARAARLRPAGEGPVMVESPVGRVWAWGRLEDDGVEVLYLPVLGAPAALDRVGTHAVGNLFLLALGTALLFLLALPRPAFRDLLGQIRRSYSRRLVIVLTLLVFLPLVLLNLFVLSSTEERLDREQLSAGEAALASAQRVLGGYLTSLEPGVDLGTVIDREMLRGLSEVLQHEVSLYYRGGLWAESKPELFSAALLPERIPGEVFFSGSLDVVARTSRAGMVEYLELYAPLGIPGVPITDDPFFLSIPLLAQQEEAAAELTALRRQAVLVSTALFGLLIAVAIFLAKGFTEPLEELVEGTRRIAAGAPSLGLAPSELELAALASAVDEMVRRIAEGRERLVREKAVVERVVESVTSGVVSLDHHRRVLMHNRVAGELLGVQVGERLDRAVASQERLAPVAEFLSRVGRRGERTTVRLSAASADDKIGLAGDAGPADDGDNADREWSLVWVPVPGMGEPSALLVVEDATEVLRAQRLEAWAEMARIIAHEIKNPLTPIRLSAEHMREVYAGDPEGFDRVFERCTTNILRQVDELRSIATEFSAYSSIPAIDPRPGDLLEALRELVDGYRSATARGVSVELETDLPELPARFDERLLGRSVRNLIENALRASATGTGGDGDGTDADRGRVVVRLGADEGWAAISVLDSGPGVDPELLGRIFDPYFSTHDSGTGLGLPIARRVAEEHGGTISARNRPRGGLEVTVRIPLTRS